MFHVERAFALAFALTAGPVWAAGAAVTIPGEGLQLPGRLYRPEGAGPFPAIVMMHGCNGMWAASGREPTLLYRFWAEHFMRRGYVTLLVDSFGPRGEREICTQAERKVSEARDRPRDAYAALRWLAARDDVDARRISVMGWSNGAMAVMHALRPDAPGRGIGGPEFRSAVAFYPGCNFFARTSYQPIAPLLIQAGAADDWTPASPCETVARRVSGAAIEIDVYDGAHHGFDSPAGVVRTRPEVRNPTSPSGRGATVGPNPEARAKAIARATAYIEAR